MATRAELIQAYLSYFGRPPDFDGLKFYENIPFADVIANFSKSPESVALYGSVFGAAQVNAIYQNLFNRDAEPAGLDYWSGRVNSGALSAAAAAYGIMLGAQNDDKTSVDNKIAIINLFNSKLDTAAEIVGYAGSAAAASARAYIKTVGSTAASVTTATTGADAAVAAAVAVGSSTGGLSLTLTTGVDSLTGSGGNDTFTADNSTATKTLGAADTVSGGAGTDTLRIFNQTTDAINTQATGTMSSIENVYLNSGTLTTTTTLSVAAMTGVTSLEVDTPVTLANASSFTFTMGAGQSLGLTKVNVAAAGASTINVGSAATVTSIALATNASGTDTTNTGTLTADITGTGVATLNLTGNTAASKFTLANTGAALKTVNVSGTAGETVVMAIAGVTKIDASTATGAQSWDVSGAARQAAFTFTGGTAADRLTLAAGDFATLTAASQLDGGAGTDTLVIKDTTPVYASLNAVKNFEVLGLGVTGTTVDAAQLTSIKSFTFGALATETINNIGAGSTVTTTGNNTTVTLSAAVGNTSVGLVIGSATSTGLTVGTLVTTGLTANTLASNGTATNTITTLTNSDNSSFTISGAAGLTITDALAGTSTGSKIDGTAMTGNLSVVGSTKADVLIGGAGADTLSVAATGTANQSDTLTGNAGADNFKFLSATGATFFAMSAGTSAIVKITDFVAATDKFNFVTTGTAFTGATVASAQTVATAATLTEVYAGVTAIAASTATNVSASVITVSAGAAAGKYLYVNDATAGVSNTTDMLINITGVSGTITAADFSFA